VLIAAIFIGITYLLLFFSRNIGDQSLAKETRVKKKQLERIRNLVNYITPLVLIAMLYHFWQEGKVFISVLIVFLLLDRLNELRKTIK
jgi:Na+/H+ antiporter NhaC